jgi:hypothetical protein
VFLKFSEVHVQLESLPEAFARFPLAFRAYKQIQESRWPRNNPAAR